MTVLLMTMAAPLATALFLMLFRSSAQPGTAEAASPGPGTARWLALGGSIVTLIAALILASEYSAVTGSLARSQNLATIHPQLEVKHTWMTFGQLSEPAKNLEGTAPQKIVGPPKTHRLEFYFGIDGVSLAMILLTTVLSISAILISWETIQDRATEFYTCLLVLEAGLIGVFCAFDLLLFYVFFEFTLIPLFFLVGIWGGPQRKYAAVKFFLYTLVGSLITLLGMASLVLTAAQYTETPFSLPELAKTFAAHPLDVSFQISLFLALAAGFMVKVPLFPFHTWLPLAHVEAPTAGSVMLAGVLLKLGAYGFFRICLTLLPGACESYGVSLIGSLSVIGILYGSLCSLAQRDIKKLIAYSSVAHMGFCMLGMFALNVEGISGGVLQMINHGLSTGALFLLVGMVYDRYHTRKLDDLGGLARRLPLITVAMVFISMASIGLPGLNGFVGEYLCLSGMFKRNPTFAILGLAGVVLGAWYLLTMLQQGFFGPLREPLLSHGHGGHGHANHGHSGHAQSGHGHANHQPGNHAQDGHAHGGHGHAEPPLEDNGIYDMDFREGLALLPLAALCLWIGVYPQPVLNLIEPDVATVAKLYAPVEPVTAAVSPKAVNRE